MRTHKIRFIKPCWNAIHGSFNAGDELLCDQATADHFVVDAHCAEHVTEEAPAAPPEPVPPVRAPARRSTAKTSTPAASEGGQAS